MEVSLIKEGTDGSTKDAEIVSKSTHDQQIVLANNHEQGTHKCDHFTIRGYVADVRKREMKLCCPLFKSQNRTPDEHPNSVPPLVVKKFRQWNCQNCLHEITATETAIGNGTSMNTENDQVNDYRCLIGNTTVASQPSAKSVSLPQHEITATETAIGTGTSMNTENDQVNDYRCLIGNTTVASQPSAKSVSLPQQPEENFLEGVVIEKDSSVRGSNGKCLLLISSGQQVNELQSVDLIKEGVSVPRSDQDRPHEDKRCPNQPLITATEVEASQGGNIVVRPKTSEAAINGKHRKDTELVHVVGDAGISKKVTASMSFNVAVSDQRDDQGLRETQKIKDSSKNVVEGLRMPRKDVAVRSPHYDFNCLDRSSHEERNTNMGFTDTMVHTQDDIVYPTGSGDKLQNKRPPKMRSIDDIMRSEDLCKVENIVIPSGGARIKGKGNAEKVSIIKGDGVSGEYNGKCDASNFENRNLDHRSEVVTKNAEPKPSRKRKIPRDSDGPCLSHWVNKLPRKPKSHKRDAKGKHSNTEVGKCDSAAMIDIDLNLKCSGEENKRQISDKKKKNKRPIEVGASSQMLKDSFDIQKHSIQPPRKGEKKQKNLLTSEQQEEDDIPMDIVELLAKSRQERRLMDDMAGNGSTHNLVMAESMKDDNRCNMADRERHYYLPMMTESMRNGNIGAYGEKVSDEMHCSIPTGEPLSNSTEYGYLTAAANGRKAECEQKGSNSSSKKILNFDLNQAAPTSVPMDSQAFSPSVGPSLSGGQLAPSRNCSPQDAYWNSMETLPLHSDHVNCITPCHNSSSVGHDGSSILLNGAGFGNFDLNVSSNDLHRSGTPKAVEHYAGFQKNKGESSINEGRTFPTKPFTVAVNGHNPEIVYPVDIDTNESMTATTLLELMDHYARSGEDRHSLIHNVNIRSEVGATSAEGTKLPRIFESSDQGQQAKNPTIPFRPVARVGGVGPLLQREIATSSNNCMSSFGFTDKTNAVGKGEEFYLNATFKDYSTGALSHTRSSVTRNGIVQHVTNNKNNAFQPVRGTPKMEKCVLNRNPADFAMIGEDSEYMIGYKEQKPRSSKLQSPPNPKGRKRQKVMTVNNLKGSNRS